MCQNWFCGTSVSTNMDIESTQDPSDSGKRVCPFKQSESEVPKRTRVEEPGCEIGTNGRTFQVLDEVGSDSEDELDGGDSLSQDEEFGKSTPILFVVAEVGRICLWIN